MACISFSWLFVVLLLTCSSLLSFAQEIPAALLEKAMLHAQQLQDAELVLEKLQKGDVHTLYKVAKSMNDQDPITSVQIWQALAADQHVLSQVALGFAYSKEHKPKAIEYFVQAGENGPHQAALYNAGRLYLETDQLTEALAYMRAAVLLEITNPKYTTKEMTKTARFAYNTLSQQLLSKPLSVQQAADLFLYANISDFPKEKSNEAKTWHQAMKSLEQSTLDKKGTKQLETALQNLSVLHSNPEMSELQLYALEILTKETLRRLNDEL